MASSSKDVNRTEGPWNPEEDDALQRLVQNYGPRNWSLISKSIPGRSGKSCRLRWVNQLLPEAQHRPFTPEEDDTTSGGGGGEGGGGPGGGGEGGGPPDNRDVDGNGSRDKEGDGGGGKNGKISFKEKGGYDHRTGKRPRYDQDFPVGQLTCVQVISY